VAVFGVAWPLSYMPGVLARDSSYQQRVIGLAASMLGDDDTYLAGNDLVYNRHQAHPDQRRLSAADVRTIGQWPQARLDVLIAELEAARPKLVIQDYRIGGLPAPLRAYLDTRFDTSWGSVRGYAPVVAAGDAGFDVGVDGEYPLEGWGEVVNDDQALGAGPITPAHGAGPARSRSRRGGDRTRRHS